ncbi:MAG: hypothetical protein AAGF67_14530, partial [Verrucomicrobiota bacterium]
MKTLLSAFTLLVASICPVYGSFSVSEITQWSQLKELGISLKLTPSTTREGVVRYYISLTAPSAVKSLPGKKLHRISYDQHRRGEEN